ncbi:hypothetical protein C0993_006822 [Termitomyces sp. T159_Od127]|nr:hypothetical protein C0993_006822 [Termitomyces sp. T159_Od127]
MTTTKPIEEKEAFSTQGTPENGKNVKPNMDAEPVTKYDKDKVPTQDDSLPDPRFNPPTPSPFKRAALIAFVILLLWIAFSLRPSLLKNNREAKVIYASRYSKEHKFRPAASPVITETLKDGRVRLRGAAPTATPARTPTPTPKKKLDRKNTRKRKVLGKKNGRTKARK